MRTTRFDYIKIFTIAIIVVVLVLSFMPINSYSYFSGYSEPETNKPIFITTYKAFYTIVSKFSRDILMFGPFMMTLSFFSFYIGSVLTIIYSLFNKTKEFFIFFIISTICMVPYIFTFMYVTIFALVTTLAYATLLTINVVYFKKLQTNSDEEVKIRKAINYSIANNIKKRRKELGLTQEEVAKETFMSRSLISKIESGKVTITDEHLGKISKCLDTTSDALKVQ